MPFWKFIKLQKSLSKYIEAERNQNGNNSNENDEFKNICADEIQEKSCAWYSVLPPPSKNFTKAVSKEILMMLEDYPELAYEEILLAIRFNASSPNDIPSNLEIDKIKFFGSFIGVGFLSLVLDNYMKLRKFLDRKLKNLIDGFE